MFGGIGSILDAFTNAALGTASLGLNAYNMYQQQQNFSTNYEWQKALFGYNVGLQNIMFSREDNAVQRRVADLKAAGLSPVLAAGQAANAGPVIHQDAPQRQRAQIPDLLGAVMSLMKMKEDISNTVAQRDLIKAQEINAKSNTFKNLYDLEKTRADIANKNIDTAIKSHDYNIFKKTGTTSQGGTLTRELRNAQGLMDSIINNGSTNGIVSELLGKAIESQKNSIQNRKPDFYRNGKGYYINK